MRIDDFPKNKIDAIVHYDQSITIENLSKALELTTKEIVFIYDYVVDNKLLKQYGKEDGGYKLKPNYAEEWRLLREVKIYEAELNRAREEKEQTRRQNSGRL